MNLGDSLGNNFVHPHKSSELIFSDWYRRGELQPLERSDGGIDAEENLFPWP